MRAAASSRRNLTQALWALLRGRLCRWCGRACPPGVHRSDHEEIDRRRYQQEAYEIVEKRSVANVGAVDGELKCGEIGLRNDGGDQLGNDVVDKGLDHRAERSTDNHGDGEIDHVAAQNELFEAFEHDRPPQIALTFRVR